MEGEKMLKILKMLIRRVAIIANQKTNKVCWEWVCERLVNWHNNIVDKKRNKYIKKTGDVGGSITKYMYTTYGAWMKTADRNDDE